MRYSVYQLQLSEGESEFVNLNGWDYSAQALSKVNAYLRVTRDGTKGYQHGDFKFFKEVADCDANSLNEVFELMNLWDRPERVNIKQRCHSLSVGDIISDTHTGLSWMVDMCGFDRVEIC